jgi:hypothetical protein
LFLFVLCMAIVGCGEEKPAAPDTSDPADEPTATEFAQVLIEINATPYYPKSDDRTAMDALRGMVEARDSESVQIDPSYERAGQLLLIVKPAEQADTVYTQLKEQFDLAARQAVQDELAAQELLVKTTAEDVQKYQQLMQRFQQGLALEVEVNGSKLDQRKLDRLLTTTLTAQIEAEKRVEALQTQIERERYAKLLRLR